MNTWTSGASPQSSPLPQRFSAYLSTRPSPSTTGAESPKQNWPSRQNAVTSQSAPSWKEQSLRSEASFSLYVRRPVTGRLLERVKWRTLSALLTVSLLATAACTSAPPRVLIPPPVVVQAELPTLLRDRGDEVQRRWGEIRFGRVGVVTPDGSVASVVTDGVLVPRDLWLLITSDRAAGWSNTKTLLKAGWGK